MSSLDFAKMSAQDKAKLSDRSWTEEFSVNPDNEIVQDPHWYQVITRSSRGVLANSVSKCEVDAGQIDKRIQQTIATYKGLNAPFHWIVAPSSKPTDLGKRLASAGMRHSYTWHGLVADSRKIKATKAADVSVEALSDKNMDEYTALMAHDDFTEPHAIDRHRKHVAHHHKEKQSKVGHFLARIGGQAVGAGHIRYHDGYAFLPGGAVHVKPAAEGKGVFGALVAHMAADAAKRGLGVVSSYSGNRSLPQLVELGFEKTSDYPIYTWHP